MCTEEGLLNRESVPFDKCGGDGTKCHNQSPIVDYLKTTGTYL